MPRYPKSLASEAAVKVGALIKEGVKPVAAYATVAKDVGVPAATVGRWYKQATAKRVRPPRTRTLKSTPAMRGASIEDTARTLKAFSDRQAATSTAPDFVRELKPQPPKLSDLAGEFEALNREIPALEEKLVTLTDRREELRKLIADGLGL